jgi:hypothetical protein
MTRTNYPGHERKYRQFKKKEGPVGVPQMVTKRTCLSGRIFSLMIAFRIPGSFWSWDAGQEI